ncbi:Vitamin D-binding protein [Manis javanica]|nr:Vitamin D-binding protein [Manis javanica]
MGSHLIKLAQKVPTADLEDVLPLAEDVTTILAKCCESTSEDCMAKEKSLPFGPSHLEDVSLEGKGLHRMYSKPQQNPSTYPLALGSKSLPFPANKLFTF